MIWFSRKLCPPGTGKERRILLLTGTDRGQGQDPDPDLGIDQDPNILQGQGRLHLQGPIRRTRRERVPITGRVRQKSLTLTNQSQVLFLHD